MAFLLPAIRLAVFSFFTPETEVFESHSQVTGVFPPLAAAGPRCADFPVFLRRIFL
jgi:hypothetical protein